MDKEMAVPSSSQIRFLLKEPNTEYKVIIEGAAPENILAGDFNITFYGSSNPGNVKPVEVEEGAEPVEEDESTKTINRYEVVQPVVYTDQYKPYKYAVIFKERLFLN